MKTSVTLVLAAMGGLGLLFESRAAAQQPLPGPGPASAVMQPGSSAPLSPTPTGNVPAPPIGNAPAAGAPMPTPAANGEVDTSLLVDNGLWDRAAVPPCCAICGGGCCAPADWSVEQDVRILNRSRPRDVAIGVEFSNPQQTDIAGSEVLNDRTATPNISAAWGMTIAHYFARDTLNRDHFIEFSFWGLNSWQDQAIYNGHRVAIVNGSGQQISEQGDLYSGYAVTQVLNTTTNESLFILNGTYMPGFDEADTQTTYYSSSTNNFEINGRIVPRNAEDRLVLHPNGKWRRECQPGLYMSYLYGLRFMQINETFRLHGQSQVDTYDPTTGILIDSREDTGDYGIVAHNNLLGFQVGAEMTWRQCRWSWGIRSKIGPYVNFADQESIISSVSTDPTIVPYNRRLAYAKHDAAMIADLGIEATYKFRPNLMGRAAYDITWVSGVALAPEQLQFNTDPVSRINTNGLAYFHGITLGLEWLW